MALAHINCSGGKPLSHAVSVKCLFSSKQIKEEIRVKDLNYLPVNAILFNNWFMLLAVHYRVMAHLGSLESTQEARVPRATLTLPSCPTNFPSVPLIDSAHLKA